jgi:NADH:ubiquinone oxidoreductase subunit
MKIGDLKFGELKGTDGFGNKYYEASDKNSWILVSTNF